jgi:hypothetical protein
MCEKERIVEVTESSHTIGCHPNNYFVVVVLVVVAPFLLGYTVTYCNEIQIDRTAKGTRAFLPLRKQAFGNTLSSSQHTINIGENN